MDIPIILDQKDLKRLGQASPDFNSQSHGFFLHGRSKPPQVGTVFEFTNNVIEQIFVEQILKAMGKKYYVERGNIIVYLFTDYLWSDYQAL